MNNSRLCSIGFRRVRDERNVRRKPPDRNAQIHIVEQPPNLTHAARRIAHRIMIVDDGNRLLQRLYDDLNVLRRTHGAPFGIDSQITHRLSDVMAPRYYALKFSAAF